MKRFGKVLSMLLCLFTVLMLLTVSAVAQNYAPGSFSGLSDVQQFNLWTAKSTSAVAAGAASMSLDTCYFALAEATQPWFPFAIGENIKVIDSAGTSETVAITAVSTPTPSVGSAQPGFACAFSATFASAHSAGVRIVSADGGLGQALAAIAPQGGTLILSPGSGVTAAGITAALPYPSVTLEDVRLPQVQFWNPQPTTLSALATPATRSATAGNTQVISGTAVGTWAASTYFVCVTYVDIMGNESPCSASFSFTATASVALNFAEPAASTGAVGWIPYAGLTGTSTQYRLIPTAAQCALTTIETVTPACALTNATYGQAGSGVGVFTTPTTATSLAPGYTVNTYRPNTQSASAWAYEPSPNPPKGFRNHFGPFVASAGGTTGQIEVLGTAPLPVGYLNYINQVIRVSGHITMTAGTSETPVLKVQLGPTFTTGTPTNICQFNNTTALSAAVYSLAFTCTIDTNAIGATGTVMPDGMAVVALGAGTTAGTPMPELATAAITDSVSTQDWVYVTYIPTSGTNTAAQLLDLQIETL